MAIQRQMLTPVLIVLLWLQALPATANDQVASSHDEVGSSHTEEAVTWPSWLPRPPDEAPAPAPSPPAAKKPAPPPSHAHEAPAHSRSHATEPAHSSSPAEGAKDFSPHHSLSHAQEKEATDFSPPHAAEAQTAAPSDIHVGKPMNRAIKSLKENLYSVIDAQQCQPLVAGCALVFGLAALIDGYRSFQVLVFISVVAVTFCFVMSQLEGQWNGRVSEVVKTVASLEAGLFIGMAAYKGWEGTQLVLGFSVGVYLFHIAKAVMPLMFNTALLPDQCVWITCGFTAMVVLGIWMVNEKGGAGRVLAILAPLFGASLVVATLAFLFTLYATVPNVGKALHVSIKPSEVPSVFDFWYMMVYPWHSKAVGYFELTRGNVDIGANSFEPDRVICIFFWGLFSVLGAYVQWKGVSRAQAKARNSRVGLRGWLLGNDKETADETATPNV